ncbi:MAG: hypothetical protein JWO00_657 [Candidatus Parcubacteria bacterium]|nr:hypothetical protein [Candidatus Parcubacteria bacterium]
MPTSHSISTSFLKYNREQSNKYTEPGQTLLRRQYRKTYTAQIAALKCMDGRINMAVMTQTPLGIIQPYRDLGGKFDLGSEFGAVLAEWINHGIESGRSGSIVLVTYHWSKGDPAHRGCKGFSCDVKAARSYTQGTVRDIEDIFGADHGIVHPIQVGIETDEDSLVFHGNNGKKLDLSEVGTEDPISLRMKLEELYPDMTRDKIESLIPLCVGNVRHIAEVRKINRPIADIDHKENILGYGRGFDWHHQPNQMLIVGPFNDGKAKHIQVACSILFSNLKQGKISKGDGLLLVASSVFRDETGPQRKRAEFEARSRANFLHNVVKEELDRLKKLDHAFKMPRLEIAAGTMNQNTRLFIPVKLSEADLALKG